MENFDTHMIYEDKKGKWKHENELWIAEQGLGGIVKETKVT